MGYVELAKRLSEIGLPETEGSVTVKINRGAFPAWFFFAAMKAVGAHTVRLHEAAVPPTTAKVSAATAAHALTA